MIYTGDVQKDKKQILNNVEVSSPLLNHVFNSHSRSISQKHFGIFFNEDSANRISFAYLRLRSLLEAKWYSIIYCAMYNLNDDLITIHWSVRYPVATMLFQSLASCLVALECVFVFVPDIFCDSTGAAFTYPVLRYLTDCGIMAYVHYPVISSVRIREIACCCASSTYILLILMFRIYFVGFNVQDMLNSVRQMRPSYNNASVIASSVHVSSMKVLYYKLFAAAYSFVGSYAVCVIVNSSWTEGHIADLWNFKSPTAQKNAASRRLVRIYPPCNTDFLQSLSLQRKMPIANGDSSVPRYIISIGQFRPEKDHALQIR